MLRRDTAGTKGPMSAHCSADGVKNSASEEAFVTTTVGALKFSE